MKKFVSHIAFGLLMALLVQSCSKNEFPQENDTPAATFKASGTINGEPVSFQAGHDGYFMHTDHEGLLEGQWIMNSIIAPSDCQDCDNSLGFSFFAHDGSGNDFDINEHLLEGEYDFYTSDEPLLQLMHLGELSDETMIVHLDGYQIDDEIVEVDGLDWVNLEVTVFDGVELCFTELGFMLDNNACEYEVESISAFEAESDDEGVWVYPPQHLLDAGIPVAWYTGWLNEDPVLVTNTEGPFFIEWGFNDPGTIAAARADEGPGDETYWCMHSFVFAFDGAICEPFDVHLAAVPDEVDEVFEIRYFDDNGNLYSSTGSCDAAFLQAPENHLEVTAIEEYIENLHGDPTLRFHISGQCALQNVSNSSDIIMFENIEGDIAVSYPVD